MVGNTLLTTGMFMDSLIYSNIASNMAEGIGSFWHPTLSEGLMPEFYGHPPLVMGLMSIAYRCLGSAVWVTRLYSMIVFVLTGLLIVRLWRRIGFDYRLGWLPLLGWLLIPAVSQSATETLLEGTMALFVLASVICMTHTTSRPLSQCLWHLLAGVMLFGAFLCKGFTGLYPLALPGIIWLTSILFRGNQPVGLCNKNIWVALRNTIVTGMAMALCYLASIRLMPEMAAYMDNYYAIQVMDGIKSVPVTNRAFIISCFLERTAIVWVLFVLMLIVGMVRRKKQPQQQSSQLYWGTFCTFMLLALAGVLPITISPKQRSFYILTTYPFVAIAVAAVIHTPVEQWMNGLSKRVSVVLTMLSVVLAIAAVGVNAAYAGKPGRDAEMQQEVMCMVSHLEPGERVGFPERMHEEYSLQNYFYRDARIVMIPIEENDTVQQGMEQMPQHFITDGASMGFLAPYYQEININTIQYKLFQRL